MQSLTANAPNAMRSNYMRSNYSTTPLLVDKRQRRLTHGAGLLLTHLRRSLRAYGLLLLPLLLLAAGCGSEAKKADSPQEIRARITSLQEEIRTLKTRLQEMEGEQQEEKVNVALERLQPQRFRHYIEVQGQVESDKSINVSPQRGGTLQKLYVEEGDYVQAGQKIAHIDDAVLRQQLEEVKTRLELARTNYERRKRLYDKDVGSEMKYLQAKSEKESLEKRLAQLKEQLDLYTVKAPMSGKVDRIIPKQGENVAPGRPIVQLVSTDGYKISAGIAERYAGRVDVGDPVKIRAPDLQKEFGGQIKNVAAMINPASRSFEVDITPQNPPKGLRPNLITYVKINDYTNPKAITVPITLVQSTDRGAYVYTAQAKNGQLVAKKTFVKTGKDYRDRVEIRSGLAAGDRVITKGYRDVADGQPINEVGGGAKQAQAGTKADTKPSPTPQAEAQQKQASAAQE